MKKEVPMSEINKKDKRSLTRAVCLFALSFVMLMASVFTYMGTAFGWFSSNKSVGANGANIDVSLLDVKAEIKIADRDSQKGQVDENGNISFINLRPGDTVCVELTLTNNSDRELKADFSLLAPVGCETPVISEGKYYYLGSQLRIKEVSFSGEIVSQTGEMYLLSAAWGETTEAKAPVGLSLHTGATLPAKTAAGSEARTFAVTFEFVNADFDQSILQNFGEAEGQTCYRRLDAAYSIAP